MLSKAQANPARSANVVLCGDTTTTSVLDVGGCRSVICISSFIFIPDGILFWLVLDVNCYDTLHHGLWVSTQNESPQKIAFELIQQVLCSFGPFFARSRSLRPFLTSPKSRFAKARISGVAKIPEIVSER
jgi:hypothetical protein